MPNKITNVNQTGINATSTANAHTTNVVHNSIVASRLAEVLSFERTLAYNK